MCINTAKHICHLYIIMSGTTNWSQLFQIGIILKYTQISGNTTLNKHLICDICLWDTRLWHCIYNVIDHDTKWSLIRKTLVNPLTRKLIDHIAFLCRCKFNICIRHRCSRFGRDSCLLGILLFLFSTSCQTRYGKCSCQCKNRQLL